MNDPREFFQLESLRPWLEEHGFYSRDWGLLSAAVERPWATFEGQDLYPDIWHKTAALLSSIEANHPLIDGNKRLGALLSALMLQVHGIHDSAISDDDFFALITDVATYHPDVEEIASRLQKITNLPPR
ncbi:death-on-curing family protein [Corynebacterium suranareeae]|uniref:Death-on-curing family protein n=1 Tax=Corynebacterium suranareeae TaxID=2506452 RepID=A0A160PPV6_9CORY|nr:Fic family protein [Corynebacterium suranareeae]BAU94973.1 death-on-curing family protein [Corynebacterium suranareeae]